MREALRARGVPDPAAGLAAELGVLAFKMAYARWTEPDNQQQLGELARASLHELHVASTEIG